MKRNEHTIVEELNLFSSEVTNTESAIQDNPFYNRRITLLGDFPVPTKSIVEKIQEMGGEVEKQSRKVTKNTHYVLMGGNVVPEYLQDYEQLIFNGFLIKTISYTDYIDIINGSSNKYKVPAQNKKQLHLTYKHYERYHINFVMATFDDHGRFYLTNSLSGKNVYLGEGITGDRTLLAQMLGNVGVFGGSGLSSETDVIVLSEAAFEALKNGDEHPEIKKIESEYNNSKAIVYKYVLTTERELLAWLKNRIDTCADDLSEKYYKKFIQSKQNM